MNLLIKIGVQNLIICPGSRSAPLAIAAGELNKLGLVNIFNSIEPYHQDLSWSKLLSCKGEPDLDIAKEWASVQLPPLDF